MLESVKLTFLAVKLQLSENHKPCLMAKSVKAHCSVNLPVSVELQGYNSICIYLHRDVTSLQITEAFIVLLYSP